MPNQRKSEIRSQKSNSVRSSNARRASPRRSQPVVELPPSPRRFLLPAPHRLRALLPTFGAILVIGLAIAGALVFGWPEDSKKSSQAGTEGDWYNSEASLIAEPIARPVYSYTWSGEALSAEVPLSGTEAGEARLASFANEHVTEASFRRVSQAFGLGETIRKNDDGEEIVSFESGVELRASGTSPLGASEIDDAVYSDPNAYQLSAYSSQTSYWYTLLSSGNWMTDHPDPPPSADEAKTLAVDFFRSRGLLPSDAGGPYVRDPSEIIAQIGAPEEGVTPGFVSVYFTRLVDGREVVDESGEPLAYLSLDIGTEGKTLAASGPFVTEPSPSFETQTGLSAAKGWEEITEDRWGPGRTAETGGAGSETRTVNITMGEVDRVMLAVPPSEESDRSYAEPAYRFSGTISGEEGGDAFPLKIVVPAMQTSRYAEYLNSLEAEFSATAETETESEVQPY